MSIDIILIDKEEYSKKLKIKENKMGLRITRGNKNRGVVEYNYSKKTISFGTADKKAVIINKNKIIDRLGK